jgi:transcriptional regulator with XRE-family HTH domain
MSDSFGARLRRRREQQDIALVTIAEQTKIKLSLLEALERGDVSQWPAGIFRRAFVRAYAHAIGLDPDVVVREFLEAFPDPVEDVAAAAAMVNGQDQARPGVPPPTRLRHLVGSAIGSLVRLRRPPAPDGAGGGEAAAAGVVPNSPARLPPATPLRAAMAPPASVPISAPAPNEPEDLPELPAPSPAVPVSAAVVRTEPRPPDPAPPGEARAAEPDFLAAAELCTELGRVENATEVQPLLQKAATILDAIGLIVWVWDPQPAELKPAMACGYSDRVLAQLPTVKRDGDNVTAAAFRSARTCAVDGSDQASGALVVPLLTPAGCSGVLAIELQHGVEQTRSVRALATIFAAQLAQLTGDAAMPAVRPEPDPIAPVPASFPALTPRAGSAGPRQRLTGRVGRLNA